MNNTERDTRSLLPSDRSLEDAVRALVEAAGVVGRATALVAEILERRYPSPNSELISAKEAAKLLGCSIRTLETYRDCWIEKVHYFRQKKGFLYNRVLLQDWLKNRFDEAEHQRAIELWLQRQPQNQPQTRGRKAGNK